MNPVLVFLSQFVYVMLLGLQSRNVRDGQTFAACVTSTFLGFLGVFLMGSIARVMVDGGSYWIIFAYVAAGPCGIATAIWMHDWFCD